MEVDKTIVILAVVALVILGIFALSQLGHDGNSVSASSQYLANQYGGGGCGR